jgi:NADP-dependent 3-hydroxy acid dehydrogenase YdfG
MSDALRKELTSHRNEKIRVSNLSPGETRTQICDSTVAGSTDDYYAKNPALDPEEVAAGVVFILSLPYNVHVTQLTMRSVNARV